MKIDSNNSTYIIENGLSKSLKFIQWISIFFLLLGAWGVFNLYYKGLGIWGISNNAPWGWAIVNFVFWIGLGHAGTLISAILLVFNQKWRYSFSRIAEMMTIICVICAFIYPAIHVGRSLFLWFLIPFPNNFGIWQQFKSPLIWDCFAIFCYFTVSVIFFVVGMLPDMAILRDKFFAEDKLLKAKFFQKISFGWRYSEERYLLHKRVCYTLACLAMPLVISVHSIVSSDFAVCILPNWNTTLYPAYFVAGAIFSGIASVLLVAIPLRKILGLESVMRLSHIDAMCKICLSAGLFVLAFYVLECSKFKEEFHSLFLWMIILNCIIPQILWFKKARRNIVVAWVVSLSICIGMWLERFNIVVNQFLKGYGIFEHISFVPTIYDIFCFVGGIGLFLFILLQFLRYIPIYSFYDEKEKDNAYSFNIPYEISFLSVISFILAGLASLALIYFISNEYVLNVSNKKPFDIWYVLPVVFEISVLFSAICVLIYFFKKSQLDLNYRKKSWKIFSYFGFVIILAVFIMGTKKSESPRRTIRLFNNMQNQKILLPYGENNIFSDGINNRKIPQGTVKYNKDKNVYNISDGKNLYGTFCSTCHGLNGDGKGRMKTEFGMLNISSLIIENISNQTDIELLNTLKKGRNTMMPQGRNFSKSECDIIIKYLRELQKEAK